MTRRHQNSENHNYDVYERSIGGRQGNAIKTYSAIKRRVHTCGFSESSKGAGHNNAILQHLCDSGKACILLLKELHDLYALANRSGVGSASASKLNWDSPVECGA
ncbi:hypothetical protein FRB95_007841 [Tulasnella sp. JGI-2019a]|nr:hypothetical protein FRB95_007841 [Tulasnella sp. JGI-2019a]